MANIIISVRASLGAMSPLCEADMTIARAGLMVLGSPMGSDAFMRDKVELRPRNTAEV